VLTGYKELSNNGQWQGVGLILVRADGMGWLSLAVCK